MRAIKTALVGFGFSGSTFHAPFLDFLNEFDLKIVVSSNPEKVHNHLKNVKVVRDLETALQDPEIQLVVIATPVQNHFDHAKKSLLAGKNVVLDKPFTQTADQAEELINLAERLGQQLTVFHNRRWDCDFQTVCKVISEGHLGEVYLFESHFHRYRPIVRSERWKENGDFGSGTLYDLGSHLVDQALHLFGEPDDIISDVIPQRPGARATDYFHLILKYGRKRIVLKSSSLVAESDSKYSVHGDKGSIQYFGVDPQEAFLIEHKKITNAFFTPSHHNEKAILTYFSKGEKIQKKIPIAESSYAQFYQSLYKAISMGQDLPVDPRCALKVIEIIQEIEKDTMKNM